jgi:hypothetical protein
VHTRQRWAKRGCDNARNLRCDRGNELVEEPVRARDAVASVRMHVTEDTAHTPYSDPERDVRQKTILPALR